MVFNPRRLPKPVYEMYKLGPDNWVRTVKSAIQMKITNINKLTDIAFYLNNPDLKGRPLKIGETWLAAKWNYYRLIINGNIHSWGSKITHDSKSSSHDESRDNDKWIDILSWGWGETGGHWDE